MLSKKIVLQPFTILLVLTLLFACNKKEPDVDWNVNKSEITGEGELPTTDKLNVDVYLDITTSMKGFVSASNTSYGNLLDDIEATCENTWKNTDIKYYKFGRSVQPISRDNFAGAKTSPVMFSDPILSTQTNFADAVKKTDPKRVSIVITDLFYRNSDVNIVVSSIKDYCFKNKVEVGIIGLTSTFNGIVGDVSPPVKVEGTRPLYVLVFGGKQNIGLFFKTLQNKPYIQSNQFLLITNHPTESFSESLVKDKKCRTVNKQHAKQAWEDAGTVFNFRMHEDEKDASFNLKINLSTNPYLPLFNIKNIKMLVFKKKSMDKDSVAADADVVLENTKLINNILSADVKLVNNEKAGKYGYLVYVTFDNTVPLTMPGWVKAKNADVYAQGLNENKTLNLEKLLTDISVGHTTFVQPKLAKFYINIEKR